MLRIELRNVKPGMTLALPIQNPRVPTRTLLRVGYTLTSDIISRLAEHRIRTIWVQYPSLSFLKKFIDREGVETQSNVVVQIASTLETLQTESAVKLPYETYIQSISDMIDHIITNPQSAVFLGDIAESSGDLMRHSSTVTYLSVLMGLKLEGYLIRERKHVDPARAKDVRNLGLGAMLHDVGITGLDEQVRDRYEQTADESDPGWQEHPVIGFRMVRGKVDASAATVVLHHHQRFDGSGYVGKDFNVLFERNIHVFARIVGVAEYFDRMRHPPDETPRPAVSVLRSIFLDNPVASMFDPEVLSALLMVVPPYPPGTIVRLSDGRYAVCIDHNSEQPCRPVVQVVSDPAEFGTEDLPSGQTIDLSDESPDLYVDEWDGYQVGDLNFERPDFIAARPGAAWY